MRITTIDLLDGVSLSYFETDPTGHEKRVGFNVPAGTVVGHVRGGSGDVSFAGGRQELARGDSFAIDGVRVASVIPTLTGRISGALVFVSAGLPQETARQLSGFGVDLACLSGLSGARGLTLLGKRADVTRVFADVYLHAEQADVSYLRLRVLELLHVLSASTQEAAATGEKGRRQRIASQARSVMTADLSRPLTIDAIASACATSPTVLKEAFRATYGMPIYSWYRAYRVRCSAEMLLNTDLPIAQVAAAVGYSSPSKYARAFNDCMGETPSAWRRARAEV